MAAGIVERFAPLTDDVAMDGRSLTDFTDKARGLDVIEIQG